MLHWIINPGLAFNELILGQRIPKIMLIDKTSDKPFLERNFIPCPHCQKLHDARTWSVQNRTAFKNWFGLYCINCGQIIPCLTNGLSFILLTITFPVWGWFRNSMKKRWLEKQPGRFKNLDLEKVPTLVTRKTWIKAGLSFGFFMFVFMSLIFPILNREKITWTGILIGIPIWALAGLGFGYFMKRILSRKGRSKT